MNQVISSADLSKKEIIISSTSYSFGFAPTITGFAFLSNYGRLFKLENKNPQVLGTELSFITRIDSRKDFVDIKRIVYAEDIKQFFSAVTETGEIYTSALFKRLGKTSTVNLK